MKCSNLLIILILCVFLIPSIAWGQGVNSTENILNDWDNFISEKMEEYYIPGAVFVMVKDGRVVKEQGYGLADIASNTAVSSSETHFHLGSISKIMTTTAVMQLYDKGVINLHTDVNEYLQSVQLAQPTSLFQLLTHTAGLEQQAIGTAAKGASEYISLDIYLQENTPQSLLPAGELIIYSSVGIAVAGQVIADVSKTTYSDYLENELFGSLNMPYTAFTSPEKELLLPVATGYRREKNNFKAYIEPYYSLIPPGGDFVSTGEKMSHYLQFIINDGLFNNKQILTRASIQKMQVEQVNNHPSLRGRALGFSKWYEQGHNAIFHDGSAPGFLSRIFLLPDHKAGFFIAHNNGEAYRFNREITSAWLERFTPGTGDYVIPATNTAITIPIEEFAGSYKGYDTSPNNLGKITTLFNQIPVLIVGEEKIKIGSTIYRRIDNTLFANDSGNRAAYQESSTGLMHLLIGTAAFARVSWFEKPLIQAGLLIFFLALFLSAILSPLLFRKSKLSNMFWLIPVLTGLTGLGFLIALAVNLLAALDEPMGFIYGLTPALKIILLVPLAIVLLNLINLFLAIYSWNKKSGTGLSRIYLSVLTLSVFIFIAWLYYWNMISIW